jgi:hypothetical protein
MMVWLEGGLNPDEMKQRIIDADRTEFHDQLLSFPDHCISNSIPAHPVPMIEVASSIHRPCAVRGIGRE